jgi:hypothetical protein
VANVNTSVGYTNLPTQSITTGTATALLVPTSAQNYGTLPSPALAAGAGLYISIPPENSGSQDWDGHQFRVRIVGTVLSGTTGTFTTTLYLGTSSTAASDSSIAAAASASITGSTTVPFHFVLDSTMLWDSVTQTLSGLTNAQYNGVAAITTVVNTVITATTSPVNVSALTNLQFIPFFTFGTGNAVNTVTIKEFLIERV